MDDRVRDRLRKHVRSGNREGFDAGLEWIAENLPRPSMPTKYERQVRDETPKGDPDWSTWRCPQCGTVQAGSLCGYCERQVRVNGRRSEGEDE